ncbi:hypothetical protein EAX61_00780 [Dokdonia sinensis]|uniref:Toxin-antitoxin system YwqK family antitoxin n=1 Tax=Dokdonia sinensis TaxID=2479847 RepID=A0A3M0GI46_9FLAO|nr:hypothetical protein [Dokdonia sinensis]RMB63948.1 hypothetical protein EAX61_00780 [Dokdonia sinensis]
MKYIFNLLFLICCTLTYGQDTLSLKKLSYENNLAYSDIDDNLFTGVAQKVRKNGHVVFEELYRDGVILEYREYYNFHSKTLAKKIHYHEENPFRKKEQIRYYTNNKDSITEYTFYDKNQLKTLVKRYRDTTLIYSIPYLNGKKNGQEFCFDNEGKPMITEFVNGKKVEKQKIPLP